MLNPCWKYSLAKLAAGVSTAPQPQIMQQSRRTALTEMESPGTAFANQTAVAMTR
jgi:hypothetical protein